MLKRTFVNLLLVSAVLLTLGVGAVSAAPPAQEGLTYTVKLGDNLWALAEKYLGNGSAYHAIVAATNAKYGEDPSFANIENPSLVHPGWKILIPGAEEAAEVPVAATLQAQADQAAANKAVMGKFLELFTTGAWDEFDQVIATDCVLHYPGGVDVVGLDAMVAGWQEFFPKLKDLKFTAHAEISEGDILIEFLTFEATYEGEYMGQQIAGVPIKYNQVEMQRIKDGKIVEWWVEQDRLWMAEQLGMKLTW